MVTRQRLLETLTRFELTTDQVTGVANQDQRAKRGIAARSDRIVDNPYLLYEQDKGDEDSEPIGLETIDHGMWPEGDAALFRSEEAIAHNDQRRVRATSCAVLREAADAGDLGPAHDALHEVGHVLPNLSELAKKAELSEADVKVVDETIEEFKVIQSELEV